MNKKTYQYNHFIHFLFLVLFFFFLTPSASAIVTINSATLNGSSNVTVNGSASITASVTATAGFALLGGVNRNWKSTSWTVGGVTTCADHANHSNTSGTFTEIFTITAPATDGIYGVTFVTSGHDNCSVNNKSAPFTLTNGVTVSSPLSTAATCADYNTLAGYGIIGETGFTYGNNSIINNNNIIGTGNTPTPLGAVTTVNPNFPPLNPSAFPSFSSSTNERNVNSLNPGSYNKIEIDSNNLTTTFNTGTYYIKELILSKNNATAQLAPGDYYIEKLTMGNSNFITVNPSGAVRIFIKTSFQGGNEVGINANGNVQDMMIYLYSAVQMQIGNGNNGSSQTLTFNGTIYSPFSDTTIQLGNNNNIQGAILSAGKVDVGNNTTFNYSTAVQNAVVGAFGCSSTAIPNCTSFTYNIYHPLSSVNKLLTRVAGQSFDANVTISCMGTGAIPAKKITKIYAVAGTCPSSTAGLPILWSGSSDINDTLRTITLFGLNSTKAYSNIKLMVETNNSEINCSADNFSIRPSSFGLTAPSGTINTSPFTLQLSAINAGSGYNGSANLTTALQTANALCKKSSKFLTSSSGAAEPFSVTFVSDANASSVKTTDIGAIYLNVKDASWTAIDQPADCIADSNITTENTQGLVGCNIDNNLTLNIVPNRFDVNATLLNSNGGVFTYLSTDLNMSAKLNLNITAQNSEGITAENYSNGCYAKTSTLIIPHSVIPSPLNTINYFESNTSITDSTAKANSISISFGTSIFKDGNSTLAVKINFDRSVFSPANPFDFNITNANLTDSTGVSGTKTPTANATFVYGRVRAYDIKTDLTPASNLIELEVYSSSSTGYVSGMPQNILNWYRNLNHSFAADGNVSRGGFSAGTTNSNINVSAAPLNGLQSIGITSSTNQTVHLDISPWLWYSRNTNYDYTGDCTQHPCFDYQFFGTATGVSTGVNSGTFQGSDFNLAPAKNVIKKGVKVFR